MTEIALLIVCLASAPVAAIIYWVIYRAGLFANDEQSERIDAMEKEYDADKH